MSAPEKSLSYTEQDFRWVKNPHEITQRELELYNEIIAMGIRGMRLQISSYFEKFFPKGAPFGRETIAYEDFKLFPGASLVTKDEPEKGTDLWQPMFEMSKGQHIEYYQMEIEKYPVGLPYYRKTWIATEGMKKIMAEVKLLDPEKIKAIYRQMEEEKLKLN